MNTQDIVQQLIGSVTSNPDLLGTFFSTTKQSTGLLLPMSCALRAG